MPNLLFQATDYISSRNDLPIVQNISDVLPTLRYETDAYAHFAFYKDNPLTDKVNAKKLTVQNTVAVQPIYSNDGVALTNANGSALISDLIDNSATNITAIFVVKANSNQLHLLGMTLPTSNSTLENGFGAYLSADKAYLNVKPAKINSAGAISGATNNQNISQIGYCLVAVSVDKVKKTAMLYTMKNGVDAFVTTSFTAVYEDSSKALAVGNAYYAASESGFKTTFAEAILYNKSLSLTELRLIANRTRNRLKQNGINF